MNVKNFVNDLGGCTAVARVMNMAVSSVHEWTTKNFIPQGRLIILAVYAEKTTRGKHTRKNIFPNEYKKIWPELCKSELNKKEPKP